MQRIAMQTALGRGGAGVLVLPGDLGGEPAAHPTGTTDLVTPSAVVVPDPERVRALAEKINAARSVTLFVGAGVRDARGEVPELAGTVHAPIGHSLGGKEWIQYDNPYHVGMSGLLGYGACYDATHEADLLVLLGTDFPYDTFLPQTRTVQVDRDAAHRGRRTRLELGVQGDVGATLSAVLPLLERKTDRSFLDRMLRRHARGAGEGGERLHRAGDAPDPPRVRGSRAGRGDGRRRGGHDGVVTTGWSPWTPACATCGPRGTSPPPAGGGSSARSGTARWPTRCRTRSGRLRRAGPPGGVDVRRRWSEHAARRAAHRGRAPAADQDRGVQQRIAGHDPAGDDGRRLPPFQTGHGPADLGGVARACGIPAVTVTEPSEVRSALRVALDAPGPYLVDVRTDPNALSIPPHITATQVRGFALAATRTVLEGGVGNMIDLARGNLRSIPRP
jgi:pyruvate dehydrogenase (quinone)